MMLISSGANEAEQFAQFILRI